MATGLVKFTDKNLYGPQGPRPQDIKQDALGDCYFVATLSAIAAQNPRLIKGIITYDAHSHNFVVGLYDLNGKRRYVQVTQAEIADNITRQGGSWMDNRGTDQIAWPAVIETAYAKLYDTNPGDGLASGYVKISNGGWPKDAMLAITGKIGAEIKFQQYPTLSRAKSINLLGARVATALKRHRAITLWSVPERDGRSLAQKLAKAPIARDGLVNNHVYAVISIKQSHGNWLVELRNPWGNNLNVNEGKDSASAYISVSLDTLVNTGGLQSFRVSAY